MKTAEELYYEAAIKGIDSFTPEELADILRAILNAPGNRAMTICSIKTRGWWDDAIADPCQAILNAPGNVAMAIYYAKEEGWWDDKLAEPCQAILNAPGDAALAINLAHQAGWWKNPTHKKPTHKPLITIKLIIKTIGGDITINREYVNTDSFRSNIKRCFGVFVYHVGIGPYSIGDRLQNIIDSSGDNDDFICENGRIYFINNRDLTCVVVKDVVGYQILVE